VPSPHSHFLPNIARRKIKAKNELQHKEERIFAVAAKFLLQSFREAKKRTHNKTDTFKVFLLLPLQFLFFD
jgi:hypothetical protein